MVVLVSGGFALNPKHPQQQEKIECQPGRKSSQLFILLFFYFFMYVHGFFICVAR